MEVLSCIAAAPLFSHVSEAVLQTAAERCAVRTFAKGEQIGGVGEFLCLIRSGSVLVSGAARDSALVLNKLRAGDCFGVASLFGSRSWLTAVTACEKSVVLLFSQKTVEELMRADFTFARNYICFLTDRIGFLNRKIAAFTAGSAEKKLAQYLLSLPAENGELTLPVSMVRLSALLDLGRASLYRAFAFLEQSGQLTRTGKTVRLTSAEEFQKIYGGTTR
ncbi:MAG: Crp/Fnr family transcriptional regulator [Oscillospiraceae bacterium]|nr:Crp/Fnr family transcriptional regulator [Oscillospiraceae bacterium]